MARRQRYKNPNNRRHTVVEPLYTFRFVVMITVSFIGLIGILVTMSSVSSINNNINNNNNPDRLFTDPNKVPINLDAILVLGGGVPDSLHEPPIYVQERCHDAAKIVRRHVQEQQKSSSTTKTPTLLPILCLSAGTAHLPQLMGHQSGLPIWESTSSAAFLHDKYQYTNNLFVETTSYDTIGNAFYARTSHTDHANWKRLLIITNEFHMARTMAIFDWIFGLDQKKESNQNNYELFYLSSANVGLTESALQARYEREQASLQTVTTKLAPKYRTMANVWKFLTQDHSLYTATKLIERDDHKNNDNDTNNNNNQASWLVKQSYGAAKKDTNK